MSDVREDLGYTPPPRPLTKEGKRKRLEDIRIAVWGNKDKEVEDDGMGED